MRTALPVPPSGLPRRVLAEEVLVVLSLSLLASAVDAIISLFEAPIAGVVVASVSQSRALARQLTGVTFGLAPAWLCWYLVRRSGEGAAGIGLGLDRPRRDLGAGAVLAAIVGVAGVGVYLGSVALGVNRFVVPVPPTGHWWTAPVLVLRAIEAGLVEEVVAVAYLVTRLQQLRATPAAAVGASALLRGAYHLYQGFGGFAGNLAMGLFFGALFVRTRRAWPLVVAHVLLDVGAGVGYLLFRGRLPGLV
ncbi:MAG: membrane protein [Actinomycetota bacterium]|nr:MAG: membrane protein [Actinomycetota bacterium]